MSQSETVSIPPALLEDKRVVLGVTGGIAAYKAADLASFLVQQGVSLRATLTESATRFVGSMTFEAITKRPVHSGVFEGWEGDEAGHVTLAATADAVIVAPATANTIAAMAHGEAKDMLTATLLATAAPIIVAPAMEHHMWHHPATQANIRTIEARGVTIVRPEQGHLASGASGDGRLASRNRLVAALRGVLARSGPLAGVRVVVTAGGTHEAIDPVRFIGNRSSGQMGVALADAAHDAGASVCTIVGPTVTVPPVVGEVLRVESTRELADAVDTACADAAVLIMAAAVADFRPDVAATSKIKKRPGVEAPTITLTQNPDILAGINLPGLMKVGFAAETDDLIANASDKLVRKGLSMIVANDAVATIGSDRSRATLLYRDGTSDSLGEMAKPDLARVIVDRIVALHAGGSSGA